MIPTGFVILLSDIRSYLTPALSRVDRLWLLYTIYFNSSSPTARLDAFMNLSSFQNRRKPCVLIPFNYNINITIFVGNKKLLENFF